MIGVGYFARDHERPHSRHAAKRFVILPGDGLSSGYRGRQLCQLADAQGALDVGQPVIVAQVDHFVGEGALGSALAEIGRDAMIAKPSHAPGQFGVVGRDRAALAGRHMFDGMKAERG